MKHYQITFEVPDDFVPEEMELNVGYKDHVAITQEGEVNIEELLKDKVEIVKQEYSEGNILIFKHPEEMSPEFATSVMRYLEAVVPNSTAIGLVNNVDLLVQYPEEAVKMLEGMINKIQTRAAILKK